MFGTHRSWDALRTRMSRALVNGRRIAALATLTAATLMSVATAARAGAPWMRPDPVAHGRLVDVTIAVGGQDVPLYPSPRWDGRRYFEAQHGREYAVTLRNTTGERIGVLISVDGLNVITGQRSALASGESMYVLDPWGSATIRGWRTSLDDIRRFVFVDEERSYATRTGQANGDLGWVRVLAFRESRPLTWRDERYRINEPAPAPQAAPEAKGGDDGATRENGAPRAARKDAAGLAGEVHQKSEDESNPGTGWGQAGYDPVRTVEFYAETRPLDRITLRYEYAAGLRALGIIPNRPLDRTTQRDRGELGFAQPPRW
jgi:hypothetical protein